MLFMIDDINNLQSYISKQYFNLLTTKSFSLETLHDLLVKVLASNISSNIFNLEIPPLKYDRKEFIEKIQMHYHTFTAQPCILSWQQQILPNSNGGYYCNLHSTSYSFPQNSQYAFYEEPKVLTVEFISEDGEIKIAHINRIESMNRNRNRY